MTDPSPDPVAALGRTIGYRFGDGGLLGTALTHRSYVAEHPGATSYERLEFLGDAVLQLAVTRHLYERYPAAAEGEMAKIRAAVVSEPALARLARSFGIAAAIRLGRGEERTGGREKDSILSDVVEAVLGVVYLEGGFDVAAEVVRRHWAPLIEERAAAPGRRDYKTRLQELLVREGLFPEYRVEAEGPQHAKHFTAVVSAGGNVLGRGTGTSKKRAEQAAAEDAFRNREGDA